MRYLDSYGRQRTASNAQLKEIDQREGRIRIPGAAMDALVGLMGAALLLEKDGALLEKTLKRLGLWRDTRLAQTMLQKVLNALLNQISMRQAVSLEANSRSLNVQCSARPAEMCVNLPVSACDVLVNHALSYCATQCLRSTVEARSCPLRDVLSSIPGMRQEDDFVGICPFMAHDEAKKLEDTR